MSDQWYTNKDTGGIFKAEGSFRSNREVRKSSGPAGPKRHDLGKAIAKKSGSSSGGAQNPPKKTGAPANNAQWTPDGSMLQFKYKDENGREKNDFIDFRPDMLKTLKISDDGKQWSFQERGQERVLDFDKPVPLPKSLESLGATQKQRQRTEEGAMYGNLRRKGGS